MGVKQAPASSGTKALSPRNYDNSVSFLGNDLTLNLAPKLRRTLFGTVIALLVAAGPVAFLVYFLPQREVLRIQRPGDRSAAANPIQRRTTCFISMPRTSKQKTPCVSQRRHWLGTAYAGSFRHNRHFGPTHRHPSGIPMAFTIGVGDQSVIADPAGYDAGVHRRPEIGD
jgi:hypothetical protein